MAYPVDKPPFIRTVSTGPGQIVTSDDITTRDSPADLAQSINSLFYTKTTAGMCQLFEGDDVVMTDKDPYFFAGKRRRWRLPPQRWAGWGTGQNDWQLAFDMRLKLNPGEKASYNIYVGGSFAFSTTLFGTSAPGTYDGIWEVPSSDGIVRPSDLASTEFGIELDIDNSNELEMRAMYLYPIHDGTALPTDGPWEDDIHGVVEPMAQANRPSSAGFWRPAENMLVDVWRKRHGIYSCASVEKSVPNSSSELQRAAVIYCPTIPAGVDSVDIWLYFENVAGANRPVFINGGQAQIESLISTAGWRNYQLDVTGQRQAVIVIDGAGWELQSINAWPLPTEYDPYNVFTWAPQIVTFIPTDKDFSIP